MSNEGLSLLENAAHIGLPVPDPLKNALAQLHGRDYEYAVQTVLISTVLSIVTIPLIVTVAGMVF